MPPHDVPAGNVVFVDDDPYVLGSMRRVFVDLDARWHSEFFSNPSEALEYVKHHRCEIIVSDVSMPEMTGLVLLAAARVCQPSVFCILLSGEFSEADRLECEASGYMLVEKPCSLLHLRAIIERELEASRQKEGA